MKFTDTQTFQLAQRQWLKTTFVELSRIIGAGTVIGAALLWLASQWFVTHEAFAGSVESLERRQLVREKKALELELQFIDDQQSNRARVLKALIDNLRSDIDDIDKGQ